MDTDQHLFINYRLIFFSPNLFLTWNSVGWNSQLSHSSVHLHLADPVNDYLRIIGASKLVPALRRCA